MAVMKEARRRCAEAKKLMANGLYDEAAESYRQALHLDADHPDAHEGLGTIRFLEGDPDGALEHLRAVIRIDPLRASGYVNAGAACARLGKLDEAVDLLRQAIEIGPPSAAAFYNLGLAYRQQGDLPRAIDAYREATHLAPDMVSAYHNLGNCLYHLARYADAIQAYERALEVQDDYRRSRKALARARAALHKQDAHARGAAPAERPDATDAPAERPVDPDAAGRELLQSLTACLQTIQRYVDHLDEAAAPASRELSTAILHVPPLAPEDLTQVVNRYDTAMTDGCANHQALAVAVAAMRAAAEQVAAALTKTNGSPAM